MAYGLRLDLITTGLFTNKCKRANLTPLDRALTTAIFHFKGFSSLVSHVRLITHPPMTCAICSSPPRVYRAQRHVPGSTLPWRHCDQYILGDSRRLFELFKFLYISDSPSIIYLCYGKAEDSRLHDNCCNPVRLLHKVWHESIPDVYGVRNGYNNESPPASSGSAEA
jgi:hypothetical protein